MSERHARAAWALVVALAGALAWVLTSSHRAADLVTRSQSAAGEVLVCVVDDEGRSAEGVTVSMLDAAPQRGLTDASGEVRFPLQSGEEVLIAAFRGVDAASAGPMYIRRDVGARVDLRLSQWSLVTGKVIEESGGAVEDFSIQFSWVGVDPLDTRLSLARISSAGAGPGGSFHAAPIESPPPVPGFQFEVRVRAAGFHPYSSVLPAWTGASKPLEIRLVRR